MSYVGKLLVAPPAQTNDQWEKTLVFIYEQTKNNVCGVVLNRPAERTLYELAEHHDLVYYGDDSLYQGGQANTKALVMLHTDDWECTNTLNIGGGFRISSDNTMLSRIFTGDEPRQWRMFVGMSVWSPMQLHTEVFAPPNSKKKSSWLITDATEELVFRDDYERAWKSAVEQAACDAVQGFFSIS